MRELEGAKLILLATHQKAASGTRASYGSSAATDNATHAAVHGHAKDTKLRERTHIPTSGSQTPRL